MGEGYRGLVSLYILREIEKRLNKPIQDIFDGFVGVSTGSLIAGMLAQGYSIKDIIQVYEIEGDRIFKTNFLHDIKTVYGILGAKYKREGLDKIIEKYTVMGLKKKLAVPFLDLLTNEPIVLTKFDDVGVTEALQASCSAPTYFEPKEFVSKRGEKYLGVDGGLFADNPELLVIRLVAEFPKIGSYNNVTIVSVGTGIEAEYKFKKFSNYGMGGWAKKSKTLMNNILVVESIFDDKIMSSLTNSFYRLEPRLPKELLKLDDTSLDSDYREAVRQYAGANKELFNKVCVALKK